MKYLLRKYKKANFISLFALAKNFIIRKNYFILHSNISLTVLYCFFEVIALKENKLVDLSMDFAVKTIKLCETIKGHYSLVNQLERSATSIGANIHEANYAHSKLDFVAKLQIALKECYETEYWLKLFVKSGIITKENIFDLYNQCGTIRRILIASINTAKENQAK